MKKFLLVVYTLALSSIGFAQNCIEITQAAFITNTDGTWSLNITYAASGKKALEVVVRCGTSVILTTCYETNGSGSTSFTGPVCNGGDLLLSATLTPHTGNCTSAACGPDFTVDPPGGGALPVNMKAFYAQRKNATVILNWQTGTEINTKEFILQRKAGNLFVDVATIAARNNPTGSSYTLADANNFKAVSQYRLKIVDLDGSYAYSEIRAVKGTGMANDFTIFPNPSSGSARITVTVISEPTDVQLVDNSGRVLKTVSMNNSTSADFNNLQKGMYMIRIINKSSGESLTKKLSVIQ
jgi:hypothetical protein